MELTIEQALRQGIAAHKEGKIQEAERLYRAILQSQPTHPDANHNLGVLAVSVNKAEAALPFFKTALEANPKIEQFWLSYIDALIKEKQFDNAKEVLEQGKKHGVDGKRLSVLEAQLSPITQKTNPSSSSPSQEQLSSLLEYYQKGRHDDAEKLAISITEQFPEHQFGWKVLGSVFKQTGRISEALASSQRSLHLAPLDAEAHSNLGNTLNELGRLEEAEASYSQAIELKPDYAEAHSNLGNTLQALGRLEEAEASLRRAIALKPDYPDAHNNLGVTFLELSRSGEAIASYSRALALQPDYALANSNLGKALIVAKFHSSDRSLYPVLINLLTAGDFIRPIAVVRSILSLLRHDSLLKNLLARQDVIGDLDGVLSSIVTLEKLPLLHHLMRICVLPDLQLEALFVTMRRVLLTYIDEIEETPALLSFFSTLSLHCFTNEYIYFESDEETKRVEDLETKITQTLTQAEQPRLIDALCCATYRPLHRYDWCEKLKVLDQLSEVKTRLIEQPLTERVIAKDIPALGVISDEISVKVRVQYEENPYPRWVKLGITPKKIVLAKFVDQAGLQLHSDKIRNISSPEILVAGCGTGQHSIETASLFFNCQVTAVDLSVASLAYAQRRTNELAIKNVNYLHADILDLGRLDTEFDIVQTSGVLHHMADPMAGWRVLVNLLKPGGLMKIGLYSELARVSVVKTREEIASLKLGTSAGEIREFREALVKSRDDHHQELTTFPDFFGLSDLRDLIFHIQEHRFTIPKIEGCLTELGLKFCGFVDEDIVARFRDFYGDSSDVYDLALWHRFEECVPDTFIGMYQFWCQKK